MAVDIVLSCAPALDKPWSLRQGDDVLGHWLTADEAIEWCIEELECTPFDHMPDFWREKNLASYRRWKETGQRRLL